MNDSHIITIARQNNTSLLFLNSFHNSKPKLTATTTTGATTTTHDEHGHLQQYLKEKGALSPATAINFSMDIARNVLLVNSSADHLKVGDFGLSKLIRVQHAYDVYKMTGETGSCKWSSNY